jgi:hypothetical protein
VHNFIIMAGQRTVTLRTLLKNESHHSLYRDKSSIDSLSNAFNTIRNNQSVLSGLQFGFKVLKLSNPVINFEINRVGTKSIDNQRVSATFAHVKCMVVTKLGCLQRWPIPAALVEYDSRLRAFLKTFCITISSLSKPYQPGLGLSK